MARTATTIGKTHKGDWEILATPDVPIQDQLAKFRALRGEQAHAKYALIQYQDSDGAAVKLNLRTPDAQKAHEAKREAEHKAMLDFAAKEAAEAKEQEQPQPKVTPKKSK